jgi:hypothetical protein
MSDDPLVGTNLNFMGIRAATEIQSSEDICFSHVESATEK